MASLTVEHVGKPWEDTVPNQGQFFYYRCSNASTNSVTERQETLELRINDADSRLEHLYDALEKGPSAAMNWLPGYENCRNVKMICWIRRVK